MTEQPPRPGQIERMRVKFERWARAKRMVVDLRWDEANEGYHDLDVDWLWKAYKRGWRESRERR